MAERNKRRRLWIGLGLLIAGAAWASPWDIDMINSVTFKAYEWKMRPMPQESIQRPQGGIPRAKPTGGYQNDYIAAVDRTKPEIDTLKDPYKVDDKTVAGGKKLFQTTCAPCHGVEGKGGGPVTHNDPAKNIRRFPLPAPLLSGPGAVTALRSDGYIYGTIRNGGALMPPYGVALTDNERWSIIAYIRTLEGAQYTPPAAAPDAATPATPTPAPAGAPAPGTPTPATKGSR
jgi:mono/diheme cytochrome c family protein